MTRSQLPRRASVDTGVLIRWLGEKNDARTAVCREVVDALVNADGRIYIAAPTIAEVLRWGAKTEVPRRKELVIAAFDELAARTLGKHFTMHVLQQARTDLGSSMTHLKFDAMIVSCSIRHKVEMHIAIDSDHHDLCGRAGFPCATPESVIPQLGMRYDD